MSIWKHLFDTDYRQRDDIEETREAVQSAAIETGVVREEVRTMENRIDRLELLIEALFFHLESKGELDDEKIKTLIAQVDLADGKEDGRVSKDYSSRAPKCDACGRPFNRRRQSCVYCGVVPSAGKAKSGPFR